MKSFTILIMAVLTMLSVSVFAQDTTKHKMKAPKQKIEKAKYSCPMHPEMTSYKEGNCSKCGMGLTKAKKEQLKSYICPMKCEGDKTYDKPGKCPKCGMNLKEKEKAMVAYSCPMKCEGDKTYTKPGKCPKCGMDLKEKKDDYSNHQH